VFPDSADRRSFNGAGSILVGANLEGILVLEFQQGRDFLERFGNFLLRHHVSLSCNFRVTFASAKWFGSSALEDRHLTCLGRAGILPVAEVSDNLESFLACRVRLGA
jgi:hypothetical protein